MPADPQQLTPPNKAGFCPRCAVETLGWHMELLAHPDIFMGRAEINGVVGARRMIRVAKVTVDGTTCTVPLRDVAAIIAGGGKYEVEVTDMALGSFNQIKKVTGW